jgi:hypothetical protein
MASPNVWLRDPVLYRIRHAAHHHTGDKWCIYPMYDFAHCLSDYLEGITHSICTLEFEVHRPLYDWILEKPRPAAPAAASIRVRPPEPGLHGDEQAQAAPTGQRQNRHRLGRSAHADHFRPAPARRHARSPAPFCLQHRHHQIQRRDGRGRAGTRRARGLEQAGAAPPGGAAARQGCHDQLSRRQSRGTGRCQQSGRPGRGHAQNSLQPDALHRAG